jgi:hypothetical protein
MSNKNRWVGLIPLLGMACLIPLGIQANDMDPATEYYTALKTPVPIVLDGNLSEWGGANVIDNPRFSMFPKGIGFENATPDEIVTHDEYGSGTWDGPDDQGSVTRMLYDDENFYLGVIVTDDYHEHSAGGGGGAWNGDSIQLIITDEDRASQIALVNVALLGVEEDEPAGEDFFTVHNEVAPEGTEVFIVRDTAAKTTTYEIRFPIEVVGVDALVEGVKFGIGFAINDGDADSPGQSGWGGWGPHGLVGGKSPSEAGLVTLGGVATAGGGDPDLVAWWPLTEGSGEDLVDSVGAGVAEFVDGEWIAANDGDSVPDFLAGKAVASFDGNASFALLGEELIPLMDETTPFSITFWTNQVGGGTGVNEIVLGNRYMIDGADFAPREFIKFTPTQFEFHQNGVGSENVAYGDVGPIPDETWTHHAIVKEGSLFTYYRDGVEANSYENTGAYPVNPQPLFIGGQQPGGEHWSGALADIGLWKRSLSATDVAKIAADGIASLSGGGGPAVLLTFNEGDELPEGIQFAGVGEIREEGGVDDSGYLKITDAVNGEYGAVVFPDLLEGRAVKSFKFTADFRVGGGTDSPADGFSVNLVRPDDPLLADPVGDFGSFAPSPNLAEASLPEEGSRTGLGIGFDEWDSGAPDVVGFSVRVDGELVTQVAANIRNGAPDDVESLQTGPIGPEGPGDISELTWQPFEVELKEDGKLTIKWKGKTVLDNFQTTFFPSPVQIVFAGRTGGANAAHHVDNIGLTIQPLDLLVVSRINGSTTGLAVELTNTSESVVDKATIALKVDGELVVPTVTDGADGKTILTFTAAQGYLPGSTHTYEITAKDMNGNDAVRSGPGEFKLKDAEMPFNTPLVGPEGGPGIWGVRYIWGAGSPGSNAGAIKLIQAADDADFAGEVFDTTSEVANLGGGVGFFPDDLLYPDEVVAGADGLWTGENFIVVYKGTLRITESGLYTFGVHSDDGFGLRIFGGEFVSKNGAGRLDPIASNTVVHPDPTGDSNTRAVANLAAGDYPIEFFWYENGGGDNGELYFAKGEFLEDADTDTWELVGGEHLVGPGALPFQITNIVKAGTDVTITFQSNEGAGYTIERATPAQLATGEFEELQDGYEGQPGDSTSFTDTGVADGEAYYRVRAE